MSVFFHRATRRIALQCRPRRRRLHFSAVRRQELPAGEAASTPAGASGTAKTVAYSIAAGVAVLGGGLLYQAATDGEFRRDVAGVAPGLLEQTDAVLALGGIDGAEAEAGMAPVVAFVGGVIGAAQPMLLTLMNGQAHVVPADAGDKMDDVQRRLVEQYPDAAGVVIADIRFVDAAIALVENQRLAEGSNSGPNQDGGEKLFV